MREQGFAPAEFYALVRDALDAPGGWSWRRDGAREIVGLLFEVSDFATWAANLQRKAAAAAASGAAPPHK